MTTTQNNNDRLFGDKELARYSRHLSIKEFGLEAQKKLKRSKVLVIGTGGLGSPVLSYLAAAGVGTLGIVDFDKVEATNLHRQLLFGESDIGKPKVEAAKRRILDTNPHVHVNIHETLLTSDNAMDIIANYDLVIDGTDNFPTRYLVNDVCVFQDKPNVYGSIFQFEGQVSVFNYIDGEGNRGPNYRDLFPDPPPPGLVPSCAEAGVLGVLPGIIGSMQASEAIKILSGVGEPLTGKLFLFDALTFSTKTVNVKHNTDNPLTGDNPTIFEPIDYEQFCGMPLGQEESNDENSEIPEVDIYQLKEMMDKGEDFQLIDVREPHEYEISNMDGELLPVGEILEHKDKIATDKTVVIHCRTGGRSGDAVKQLREAYGFDNLYNLKGGINAWAKEVDDSLPVY